MNNNLPDYGLSMEQACQALRRGDDSQAFGLLQQACLLWLDHLEQEPDPQAAAQQLAASGLAGRMASLIESLEASDLVRASDLLEYEMLPLLRDTAGQGIT